MKKYRIVAITAEPRSVADVIDHEARPLSKLRALTPKIERAMRTAGVGGYVTVEIIEAAGDLQYKNGE